MVLQQKFQRGIAIIIEFSEKNIKCIYSEYSLSAFLFKNKITNLTEVDSSTVSLGHLKFPLAVKSAPGGGLCEAHRNSSP